MKTQKCQQELEKEYYQEIKKLSTSKVSQLYYFYKKTIRNQNIVVQNVQKKKKKKKIPEDVPGMFLLVVIEEISFQLGCFECKW